MIRHVFKLIWNRKRTNFLMVLEIFVSFLVLFAVVGLGVYTADNWRRPIGFTYDRVWDVSIDMKQVSDDDFTAEQAETVRQVMLVFKEFPEIEKSAGTMLAPYEFGASSSRYRWHNRMIEFGVTEVTDGFGDLLGLKIVEGRWFGPEDRGQQFAPVVINRAMREELFGSGPAIGQAIDPDREPGDGPQRSGSGAAARDPGEPAQDKPRRIVGVVEAYREDGEFDGTRNDVI
jgi:putative ABC transport system permease protein